MKKSIILGSALAVALASCGAKKAAPVVLNTEIDSLSYSVGVVLAQNAKQIQETDSLVKNISVAGFEDAIGGTETKISAEDAQKYIQNYFLKAEKKKFGGNLEEGQAYMDAFSKEEGVISTDSGILYKYINKSSSSEMVQPTDFVKCNYVGTFTDGSPFDASKEPVKFGVRQVIPGWTELLMLMHPGDKIKAAIPYDMAYGERGTRGIPPYSTLIFEMELVEIVK